jgi:RNA polymerase sigma-70 factor (ECF subfamily)
MSALEAHVVDGRTAEQETARLFDAHSGEILAYCRRQLGSPADADDALQTTFLYVLRALRRGVEPECEAAWLTTIAKNVCHTQRRTLGRRGALSTDLDLDRIALAEPEPDEVELLAALPAALAALPDSQRNAIVMREWLGLRPAEIARRLELTTPATNALLTRARHSLAAALTASVRGPLSALNVATLANALRALLKTVFGSAAAKSAAVATAAAVSVGGVVV